MHRVGRRLGAELKTLAPAECVAGPGPNVTLFSAHSSSLATLSRLASNHVEDAPFTPYSRERRSTADGPGCRCSLGGNQSPAHFKLQGRCPLGSQAPRLPGCYVARSPFTSPTAYSISCRLEGMGLSASVDRAVEALLLRPTKARLAI